MISLYGNLPPFIEPNLILPSPNPLHETSVISILSTINSSNVSTVNDSEIISFITVYKL